MTFLIRMKPIWYFLCRKMAAVPVSEDSFTDSTLMDKWYSDHDMHMMYVGEIVEVTAR